MFKTKAAQHKNGTHVPGTVIDDYIEHQTKLSVNSLSEQLESVIANFATEIAWSLDIQEVDAQKIKDDSKI